VGSLPVVGTAVIVGLWLTAGATGALAAVTWRHRDELGGVPLAGLLAGVALWAGADAIGAMGAPPGRLFWSKVKWLPGTTVPVLWLAFVLEYTGRGHLVTRRTVAAASTPLALGLALAWAYPAVELLWTGHAVERQFGVVIVDHVRGPLYAPILFVGWLLTVAGGLALIEFVVQYDRLYRGQAVSLLAGAAVAFLGNVIAALDLFDGFDPTPFFFAVLGVAVANAFLRYDLLEFVPAARRVGQDVVVDSMEDGVVVVDCRGRIVQCNEQAARTVGTEPAAVLGRPLSAMIDDPPPLDSTEPVERRLGARHYEVRLSPVREGKGRRVGTSLVFRDVTERHNDRERLAVLNRVLRHNLRNDVNLIEGYASLLADCTDPPDRTYAEEAASAAASLGRLGEKARKVEQVMGQDETETERLAVNWIVTGAIADLPESAPDVRYETSIENGLWVDTDRRLLGAVVAEAVEAVASRTEEGGVRIGATLVEGRLRLTVDAPDVVIPEAEREALSTGEETQLRHASGLSLWLVNWAIRRLGGTLAFGETPTLAIGLPDAGRRTPDDGERVDAPEA